MLLLFFEFICFAFCSSDCIYNIDGIRYINLSSLSMANSNYNYYLNESNEIRIALRLCGDIERDDFIPYPNSTDLSGFSAAIFTDEEFSVIGSTDSVHATFDYGYDKSKNFHIEFGVDPEITSSFKEFSRIRTILQFNCSNDNNMNDDLLEFDADENGTLVKEVKINSINKKNLFITFILNQIQCHFLSGDSAAPTPLPKPSDEGFDPVFRVRNEEYNEDQIIDFSRMKYLYNEQILSQKDVIELNIKNKNIFLSLNSYHTCPMAYNCQHRKFLSSIDVCESGFCESFGIASNETYANFQDKAITVHFNGKSNKNTQIRFVCDKTMKGRENLFYLYNNPKISQDELNLTFATYNVCPKNADDDGRDDGKTNKKNLIIIISSVGAAVMLIVIIIIVIVIVKKRRSKYSKFETSLIGKQLNVENQ